MIKTIISAIILLVCTVGPIIGAFAYEGYRTRDLTEEILCRAPEKGNFSPRMTTVTVGELVKLRIRNVSTVTHGFAIPSLKIDAGEIKAGRSKIIEFTPDKVGKYDFYCTTWCSEFHLQMRGVLEVVAK